MPGTAKIQLTEQQRNELEGCVGSRTVAVRVLERAKIILGLAAGLTQKVIAGQVGVVRQTVSRWSRSSGSGSKV